MSCSNLLENGLEVVVTSFAVVIKSPKLYFGVHWTGVVICGKLLINCGHLLVKWLEVVTSCAPVSSASEFVGAFAVYW
jgi:hypothetical protein